MKQNTDYELDMAIEKIRQLHREALELSFVKDPLGFALYSVWREREDRKEECTESRP